MWALARQHCGRMTAVKTKILSPKLYSAYHYGLSREGPALCRLQPALQDSVNQWPVSRQPAVSGDFLLKLICWFCRVTCTRHPGSDKFTNLGNNPIKRKKFSIKMSGRFRTRFKSSKLLAGRPGRCFISVSKERMRINQNKQV